MNKDQAFQNQSIDENSQNPSQPVQPPRRNDPKIKLLMGLTALLIFLLVLSVVFTFARKTLPQKTPPTPTPILPSAQISPYESSQIPENLRQKFIDLETQIKKQEEFTPPLIDENIGL